MGSGLESLSRFAWSCFQRALTSVFDTDRCCSWPGENQGWGVGRQRRD